MAVTTTTTHYPAAPVKEKIETRTLAVIVDNEPGILARIAGLFTARGYNIESLTVSEITEDNRVSRITIVTSGTRMIIEQIKAQLSRLVPVHRVHDLTDEGPFVEREMALIKVAGKGETRIESQAPVKRVASRTQGVRLHRHAAPLQGRPDHRRETRPDAADSDTDGAPRAR